MKVAICLMTNYYLDHEYIEEFCEYYFNLGIDTIYLIDDIYNLEHNLKEIPYILKLIDDNRLIYQLNPKHISLHLVYPAFYKKFKNDFDWCGIFDADEFLYLPKHKNIKDYLNDPKLLFNNADVILISWLTYGDNNIIYKPKDNGIIKNYRNELNIHITNHIESKIIIRGGLNNVLFFIGHAAVSNGNVSRIKYSNGMVRNVYTPFVEIPDYTYAALEHYYTKSTEEFIARKSTGRIDASDWSKLRTFRFCTKCYFDICKHTPEKDKLFAEAELKLKNEDIDNNNIISNDYIKFI